MMLRKHCRRQAHTAEDRNVVTPTHVDEKLSLPGHPVERRFAKTNSAWKSWAPKTLEAAPSMHQKFNYADRAARLMKQELLSGSTAVTMAFWTTCVFPLSAMAMMMKSPMFRQAVDWCIGVGPGISLLYGCNHCWITPLRPNAWYLMNANRNSEANTFEGAPARLALRRDLGRHLCVSRRRR